ncbi:hypothetical protein DPMN_193235 [Dreissena polymorpha]|uniref:Uncharacterized protein n=1 Tax=Dreissena polymorpha TaxID=45954 RepID=A0A9D3Y6S3_DREPO|nr:hypothetical protein DPMN_193235 [Dreissena polymorpha]
MVKPNQLTIDALDVNTIYIVYSTKIKHIDAPTDVEHRVLIPMVRRHFLNYDSTSRRFNIQGSCVNVLKPLFSQECTTFQVSNTY